jgi:hypothetical protein
MNSCRSEYQVIREILAGQPEVRKSLPVRVRQKPFPIINVLGIVLALVAIIVTIKEVF